MLLRRRIVPIIRVVLVYFYAQVIGNHKGYLAMLKDLYCGASIIWVVGKCTIRGLKR
jgi:hypothetical protein